MATQTLFTSQFAKATFDPSKNYIYFQYLEATADMEAEEYKALLMTYLKALTKLYEDKIIEEKSLIYLGDLRKMGFGIVPELQEWTDKEFSLKILPFSKKSALLLPKDIFAHVATQQTTEEENTSKLPTQFFEDEQEALEWLFD